MKKIIVELLIAVSAITIFSSCGVTKEESGNIKENISSEEEQQSETKNENSDSSKAAGESTDVDNKVVNLEVAAETENINKKIGNAVLSGKYTQLELKTEGYDKIAQVLDSYSQDRKTEVEKNLSDCEDMLGTEDSEDEYMSNIFYESTSNVMKADSNVVSILENVYSYSGGAHPSTWYISYTYDSNTGEELKLGDIVNDKNVLPEIIEKELKKKYPEETFLEPDSLKDDITTIMDQEGQMSEYAEEGDEPQRGLTFTLGSNGLTFYFSNYEIAPYAAGVQEVTLTFDEYPEIVKDEYKAHSENYIIKFDDAVKLENGEELKVDVQTENDYDGKYTISVGDNKGQFEIYGFSNDKYLVHNEGKDFLYIQTVEENDWRHINIFSLDGTPSKVLESNLYFAYDYCPSDPANIRLSSHYDLLSTYEGSRKYHINAAGIPLADSDYDLIDSGIELTLKKDLKAEVRKSADDAQGETETVAAGTKLSFYATNGVYVDLVTEDGRYVRVTPSTESYPHTVNGENEEDIFDGIVYAG